MGAVLAFPSGDGRIDFGEPEELDEARVFRARVWRRYERDGRERAAGIYGEQPIRYGDERFVRVPKPPDEDYLGGSVEAWSDAEQIDVERWALEVLGELRKGANLRDACSAAAAIVDALEPLPVEAPSSPDPEPVPRRRAQERAAPRLLLPVDQGEGRGSARRTHEVPEIGQKHGPWTITKILGRGHLGRSDLFLEAECTCGRLNTFFEFNLRARARKWPECQHVAREAAPASAAPFDHAMCRCGHVKSLHALLEGVCQHGCGCTAYRSRKANYAGRERLDPHRALAILAEDRRRRRLGLPQKEDEEMAKTLAWEDQPAAAVAWLKKNGPSKLFEIAAAIGLDVGATKKALMRAAREGLVENEGWARAAVWFVPGAKAKAIAEASERPAKCATNGHAKANGQRAALDAEITAAVMGATSISTPPLIGDDLEEDDRVVVERLLAKRALLVEEAVSRVKKIDAAIAALTS